ncbi:MAG TPA: potassium-transporting ATPase subunit KdpA [Candidatus Dormibacteraeota bacterium]|nr:potassium-transporting ATPase subunit KdpA [Candidatus Dormibacteraeota bacterium]
MAFEILAPVVVFGAVFVSAWFLGPYIVRIFQGQRTLLTPVVRPVERAVYRVTGIREDAEQTWVGYLVAMLLVTVISLLVTYLVLRYQDRLPFQSQLNPAGLPGVPADLSFNTAVSFTTNTNWQNYSGEATMSYLSQMVGLTFHQFLSAATGIALAVALIRGIARRSTKTIGNFYVDITRAVLYLLLPIAVVATVLFVAGGAVQNFSPYTNATGLSGVGQVIAQGPVAAMEAIKDLGNNGGGFYNANSAHPWENPTGFTNAMTIWLEITIPFALFIAFGRWVGNVKQGVALFAAAGIIMLAGAGFAAFQEQAGNPAIDRAGGVAQAMSSTQSGGNMEGKEVRFGSVESGVFATTTTGTSTGAVIASHDSFTPLGGMVPMVMIQLGEITPGGIGAGLYGLVTFAIVAVFIAGLMVGRTPEYLGKKIEARDVKYAALAILILPATILGFAAWSVLNARGQAAPLNPGAHGFSEILYAYSSSVGNNGSAFAGLSGNTLYYNTTLAAAMWLGRFIFVIPVIALAGNLARKRVVPASAGTFPTDTALFTGLLIGVIVIVGALTFLPALALGPILEHLQLHSTSMLAGLAGGV